MWGAACSATQLGASPGSLAGWSGVICRTLLQVASVLCAFGKLEMDRLQYTLRCNRRDHFHIGIPSGNKRPRLAGERPLDQGALHYRYTT